MRNHVRVFVTVGLAIAFAMPALAQAQDSTPPPNVLQIFREDVKVGHGAAPAATQ